MSGTGTELAQIERTLREEPDAYWRDEDMRSRYLDLLSNPEAPPVPAQTREMADIQKLMGDHDSAYWKGPRSNELRARYRALLEERDGTEPDGQAAQSWRSSPAEAAGGLPTDLVAEWQRQGSEGFAASLSRVQGFAEGVLSDIGDRSVALDFFTSFEGLPAPAVTALYREAGMGAPLHVRPADAGELAAFKALDGGAFIHAWGDQAPKRVATVYERFNRCLASMSVQAAKDFMHWFWAITPKERGAIVWRLATA